MYINSLHTSLDDQFLAIDPNCKIFDSGNIKVVSSSVLTESLIHSLIPQNWGVADVGKSNTIPSIRTFYIELICPDFEILNFFDPSEQGS